MICDLHTHSTASDGSLSPVALLERAATRGVAKLAITDHDAVAGYRAAQAWLDSGQLDWSGELVPGVEISARWQAHTCHVVGLWIDSDCPALQALLRAQAGVRDERARAIDRKLQRAGIVGAYEGVVQLAAGAPLNRPHFARFLCEAGYCSNEQQAFTRWLGRSRRADVHCEWPPLAQVVAAIRQGGGIAVLAHPEKYALTRTRQRLLVAEFGECGGDAIEVICGSQQPETTHKLARLARDHKLAASLGSDYHGPQQSWNDVGRVAALPAEVVPVWELHPGAPHSKTTARQ